MNLLINGEFNWAKASVALVAGASITLALAPFNFWIFSLIAPAILSLLIDKLNAKRCLLISWIFGFGMYLAGASWVYVSIHDFGFASVPLALTLTAIFVFGLGFVFSIPFYFFRKVFRSSIVGSTFVFAAMWVLGEWIRSWLFTGFPWLYLGYAHIDTAISGWAPILGVYGATFFSVLTGTLIAQFLLIHLNNKKTYRENKTTLAFLVIPIFYWVIGFALSLVSWTQIDKDNELKVALIQPNIPLQQKWDPDFRQPTLNILAKLSEPHWDSDIIIFPEAAIPIMYHDAKDVLSNLDSHAKMNRSAIITGILYDDPTPGVYYNSIVGLGEAQGIYFKQRLVPFGEYVPFEKYLRGLIRFFDLPNSVIFAGPPNQKGLTTATYNISPYICYEIVYPDLVAKNSGDSGIFVTISNDAWFGTSIGPIQHFQMAQMRALENGRYVLRATNTGVSGVISHKGKVVMQMEPFVESSSNSIAYKTDGKTPYTMFGSLPILIICAGILVVVLIQQRPPIENSIKTSDIKI